MSANIEGAALRATLRRVPSPITVVTAASGEKMRGITIGSFTSLSLDPPLISFNVTRDARMHPVITRAERFAVHILREEQAHLCDHFARADLSGEEQFAAVSHRLDEHGTPELDDVLAVLHCILREKFDAADHTIIVGKVEAIDESEGGSPLVYYENVYRRVGKAVLPRKF